MAETSFSFTNKFSQRERENCERIIAELDGVPWAQPLLARIAEVYSRRTRVCFSS